MSEKREKLHQDIKKIKDLSKKSTFLSEFKEFINRGSVIDLAVGVVIGGAFSVIVTSLVNDIIMPIVSLLGGGFDFTDLKVTIPNFFTGEAGATIQYGNFIQNVVNFLIIALTIFIFIRFINRLKRKDECETVEEKEDEQIALLKEIRDSLKKSK